MKRRDLLKILNEYSCVLKRHGSNHDIYINLTNNNIAPVPRHNEIKESTSRMIFKQLGIEFNTPFNPN